MHIKYSQEAGITRSSLVEWELAPILENRKSSKLESYDGKGLPNQHIYYFISQISHLMGD